MHGKPWTRYLWWPGAALLAMLAIIECLGLDRPLAHALAWDAASGTWPARHAWWTSDLLHRGGRNLVILIAAGVLVALAWSLLDATRRDWRRPLCYLLLAILLGWGIPSLVKVSSNVDCPWHLAEFGGHQPYVALFADRPDELPRAACFPGAHSASGFALLAFFFALRERWPDRARLALGTALALGGSFAIAQELRGAHFLSHDLTSALLAWSACAWLYLGPFRARLWPVPMLNSLD